MRRVATSTRPTHTKRRIAVDRSLSFATLTHRDWRDDHLANLPELREGNAKLPTFLYAMPFSENK